MLQGNLFENTAEELISSAPEYLANQRQSRESAREQVTIGGCGLSFCAWCLKSNPCFCWRKILAESLHFVLRDFNSANGLRVSLRLEVTSYSPSSWLLRTLAHRTEEKEFSSWPTARARDDGRSPDAYRAMLASRSTDRTVITSLQVAVKDQMWPTPVVPNGGRQPKGGSMTMTGQTLDGKKRQVDLNFAVMNWPTPTVCGNDNRADLSPKAGNGLTTEVKAWPTPNAGDSKQSGNIENWERRQAEKATQGINLQEHLSVAVRSGLQDPDSPSTNGKSRERLSNQLRGFQYRYLMRIQEIGEVLLIWEVRQRSSLNPAWVSQLQGFPADWCEIE